MKRISARLVSLFLIGLASVAIAAVKQDAVSDARVYSYPASSRYQKVLPELEQTFHGPIRLPVYLLTVHGHYDLYPQLHLVSENGYEVIYAATSELCEGQHVCSWGYMKASKEPEELTAPHKVQLARGYTGLYQEMECAAYCDEGMMEWKEGSFYYTVAIKAGSKKDLTAAANSAILSVR